MANFEYLENIPKIPEELHLEIFGCIWNDQATHITKGYEYYNTWKCFPKTEEFLRKHFPDPEYEFRIQLIKNGFHVHKDFNRNECFNYILKTGGKYATTVFYEGSYDTNFSIIESHVIRPYVWHRLKTDTWHNVINFDEPRISVSVAKYPIVL